MLVLYKGNFFLQPRRQKRKTSYANYLKKKILDGGKGIFRGSPAKCESGISERLFMYF